MMISLRCCLLPLLTRSVKSFSFSFQSKSSLEMMESQSCDAEPPPPPKPELRYPGITRGNTEGNGASDSASCRRRLILCRFHSRVFHPVSCRVQSPEQGPSHPHHVQIQTHLQSWQESHGAHSRVRQPGNSPHEHTGVTPR